MGYAKVEVLSSDSQVHVLQRRKYADYPCPAARVY
jgi:hypothetical protein